MQLKINFYILSNLSEKTGFCHYDFMITRFFYQHPLSTKIKIPYLQNAILQERQKTDLYNLYKIPCSLNFCTRKNNNDEYVGIFSCDKTCMGSKYFSNKNREKQQNRPVELFYFFTLQLRDFDIAINQSDACK